MNRNICIHGHFYQPPRENPWLEEIEIQDSAHPYQNWNERIAAECYFPNTSSRILDFHGRIAAIVNNYSKMSFNFGPTLLSWMEKNEEEVYRSILAADKISQENFSGHGSAIAQVYNHIIMPLANSKDKRTQIFWGIKDFEHRFKRSPEGMWLSETAVDIESLELLAEYGIKFTILSPYQAHRVRAIGEDSWQDSSVGKVDPKNAYLCNLSSGKSITIFFYDGPISQEVAFGDLLKDGAKFAQRLMGSFSLKDSETQLVSVANDGESYGHHHKFGNMALSFLIDHIEKNKMSNITIYGEYLEKNPPEYEVEIIENTSWSCSHGVERWRADCGCNVGTDPKWNQKWRVYLRQAMDWLRDEIKQIYVKEFIGFVKDPWDARDDYISVILDRNKESLEQFFERHSKSKLSEDQQIKSLKLLEMQRHAMLMYTSCGWFFDDISGIEPVQIMQYAARTIQLAKEVSGIDLEEKYISLLDKAKSNIPKKKNGGKIYNVFVKPSVIDLLNVGAHYAISSLFQDHSERERIYSYIVGSEIYEKYGVGKQKLIIGKALVESQITFEKESINFVVLSFGDYNLSVGVRKHTEDHYFSIIHEEIKDSFMHNNVPEVINLINRYFSESSYSLWDLFKNEQGKAMTHIFEGTLNYIELNFRQIYDQYYPLMQIRKKTKMPLPKALAMTVEFILNRDILEIFEEEMINIEKLEMLVKEINRWNFMRDRENLELVTSKKISDMMDKLINSFGDVVLLENIEMTLGILSKLSLEIDLWKAQDLYFRLGKKLFAVMETKAKEKDKTAIRWLDAFNKLGERLEVNICT